MADPTGDPYEVECLASKGGCGAKPGKPCVYMTSSIIRRGPKAGIRTKGQITKNPHDARRKLAERRLRSWRRRQETQSFGPSPAVVAYRDAQVKEYEAMRKWLRRWYYVLIDPRVDGPPGSHSQYEGSDSGKRGPFEACPECRRYWYQGHMEGCSRGE